MQGRPTRVLPVLTLLNLLVPLASVAPASAAPGPATFVVNSTADDTDAQGCEAAPGDCTLREAIDAANTTAATDKIHFDLGSGVPTINVGTALPQILFPVDINGGTGGAHRVELTGPAGADLLDGLVISGATSDGSAIRRMVINGFGGSSILLVDTDEAVLRGNWIGTDETGTSPAETGAVGIALDGATQARIGGSSLGTVNVVAGQASVGIELVSSTNNLILGNYVGTNRFGRHDLGNGVGITLSGSIGTLIGPADATAPGNIVSGNDGPGIMLESNSNSNQVRNNLIGLDIHGAPLGNSGVGVGVVGSDGNEILANRIDHNGGLGIDLGAAGVTPNDGQDPDTGANQLQNFPNLTSVFSDGATRITYSGRLRTTPSTEVTVQLFETPVCDPSGFGEGAELKFTFFLLTDELGRASFTLKMFGEDRAIEEGRFVTATATTAHGTSEFSECEVVQ